MRNGYKPNVSWKPKGFRQKGEDNPLFPTIPKSVAPPAYGPLHFSTQVFNNLWKLHKWVWEDCGFGVDEWRKTTGLVENTSVSSAFPCTFPLWITKKSTFPHGFSKGCGKTVRIFGVTKIHMLFPQDWDFVRTCGEREILYNSRRSAQIWLLHGDEKGKTKQSGQFARWLSQKNFG